MSKVVYHGIVLEDHYAVFLDDNRVAMFMWPIPLMGAEHTIKELESDHNSFMTMSQDDWLTGEAGVSPR